MRIATTLLSAAIILSMVSCSDETPQSTCQREDVLRAVKTIILDNIKEPLPTSQIWEIPRDRLMSDPEYIAAKRESDIYSPEHETGGYNGPSQLARTRCPNCSDIARANVNRAKNKLLKEIRDEDEKNMRDKLAKLPPRQVKIIKTPLAIDFNEPLKRVTCKMSFSFSRSEEIPPGLEIPISFTAQPGNNGYMIEV